MPILRIEHPVSDFDAWKAVLDSDPLGRKQLGVRSYQVFRLVDDPNYVLVDLKFDTRGEAETLLATLTEMWRSVETEGLIGSQRAQIVEVVEEREYS
jgi:hypothetical protein